MNFHWIDRESWDRKPYFEHYLKLNCNYSITANLDISALLAHLHDKEMKLYPAFIYIVSKTVNALKEFRTCFNEEGKLGYWESMVPGYTIFHEDDKAFSSLWTEFSDDYFVFYQNYQEDRKRFAPKKGLDAKGNVPENIFHISSVPWVSFTGFNLNVNHGSDYLLPIITCGKYFSQNDRVLLPVSLQVHHAVCDGYHVGVFMGKMQELADGVQKWMH